MRTQISCLICALILFMLVLPTTSAISQTATTPGDTIRQEEVLKYIEPGKISEEFGVILPELKRINQVADSRDELMALDSLTREGMMFIDTNSTVLRERIGDYSINSLKNKLSSWASYDQLVYSYEKRLKDRMDKLVLEEEFLDNNKKIWESTIKHVEEKKTATELMDDIYAVIDSIQTLNSRLGDEINSLLSIQKDLSELRQSIEEDIGLIESAITDSRLSIFKKSSPAIWNSIDSASTWNNFINGINTILRENTNVLLLYYEANQSKGILHALIFIMLLGIFIVIYRYRKRFFETNTLYKRQAKIILSYPLISALILSLLAGIFIYSDRPQILSRILMLMMVVPLYMVVPRIFTIRRLNLIFYTLISLFVFDILHFLLPPESIYYRIVLLVENLVLVVCFFGFYQTRNELKKITIFWGNVLAKISLPVIIILVLALVANISGFILFSDYFVGALMNITYAGMLITLVVLVLNVLAVFLVELRVDKGLALKSRLRILKLVFRLTKILAILLWVRVILVSLGWFKTIMNWYGMLMDTSWTIKTVVISLGGIISALVIVLLTFILSKWIKQFFVQDNFLLSRMPKGVPAAISMISRYIFVTFGIYIALAAAGIDLGKFGLLAGALGVGIGFGLQSVVYNFVAGLILSVERPIHVGDTIEVGPLMGNVTEIGVRSSKVKTFDGSEVIVPNGNLISNEVVNWTLSDQKRRLKILVKTEMGVEPRKVLKIMDEECSKHPNTLPDPKPMVLFDGYGDSSLDFTLYFWVYFHVSFSTKSDVALAIYDALQKEGIGLPVPMQKYYQGDPHRSLPHPPQEDGA